MLSFSLRKFIYDRRDCAKLVWGGKFEGLILIEKMLLWKDKRIDCADKGS